jgi:hypothetical protein
VTYFVVRHDGVWKVLYDGRYARSYPTKSAAIEVAQELAGIAGDAALVVQGEPIGPETDERHSQPAVVLNQRSQDSADTLNRATSDA